MSDSTTSEATPPLTEPTTETPTETPTDVRAWGAFVYRVESIVQHPDVENLTLVRLAGHPELLVANKFDSGDFRYAANDLAVLLPVGAVLPQWLLADMDALRLNSKGKTVGTLGGNKGNRIVPRVFGGTPSNGMLRKLAPPSGAVPGNGPYGEISRGGENPETIVVSEGDNVTDFLGITQHVG